MPTDFVQRYAAISGGYWAARAADDDSHFTREQVIELSWRDFLSRLKLDASRAPKLAEEFWAAFCAASSLNPGARETVERLAEHYRLGMITNGYSESQRGRLAAAGWGDRFNPLLISQEVGLAKPDARIFNMALELLKLDAEDVMYVGDSLSHDREGCRRAGIPFCHYCPDQSADAGLTTADFRISHLSQLASLLLNA